MKFDSNLILHFIVSGSIYHAVLGANVGVWDMPSFASSDVVEFYYTETSLPFNSPSSIVEAAGPAFLEYSTSHAGIGIWDSTSDVKLTVQLVSRNFVGALLPILTPIANSDTGYIYFNNSAAIVVSNPLQENEWINSRHIATGSGVSYADFVSYLQELEDFQYYQPISVIRPTSSILNNISAAYSGNTDEGLGDVLVMPSDSYTFVNAAFENLANYGLDLETFLQVYSTAFSYIAKNGTSPSVIQWGAGQPANAAVYQWYSNLNACFARVYADTVALDAGASFFLSGITACYGDEAYVYAGPNSVYNVSLMNFSSYATPVLFRYLYNVPDGNGSAGIQLSDLDYTIIVFLFFSVVAATAYFAYIFISKKQRRRVSFEGERIAEKAIAADNSRVKSEADSFESTYNNSPQTSARTINSLLMFTNPVAAGGSRKGPSDSNSSLTSRQLRDSTDGKPSIEL